MTKLIQTTTVPRQIAGLRRDVDALKKRLSTMGSSGPRLVYGALYNDGDVLFEGSGDWALSAGYPAGTYFNDYRIAFDPVFPNNHLIVLLTPNNNNPAGGSGEDGLYTVSLKNTPGISNIHVLTRNILDPTASSQDGGFDFLVIGEVT